MGKVTFFCPACWKEVPEGSKICPHCGTSLEESARESFFEKLVGSLDHPIGFQAATAATTLGKLKDPRGVRHLLEVFSRSRDPEVHESAIWALGELRDAAAIPTLVEILENPRSFITLRIACTDALAKIGGPQAVQALRQAARSEQRSLRMAAQTELKGMGIAPT